VKKLIRRFQPRTVAIKDSTGKKLVDPESVCQRWKQYYEELYDNEEKDTNIVIQEREPPLLKAEIRRAMLKLSLRKAPGPML